MPRSYQRVTDRIFERLDLRDQLFERVFYEEVRWWGSRFTDCEWTDCKFRRTSFSKNTIFSRCAFQKCRFWAQHTYLGGPSRFEDCQFTDCNFKNVQLWDSEFVRCDFTGSFDNLVFYGPEAPEGWQTVLRDVDFSGVQMVDTDFRTGIDLGSTLMPENFRLRDDP
jgi:uncharacterized protein YjbI with pentapeptide repeats